MRGGPEFPAVVLTYLHRSLRADLRFTGLAYSMGCYARCFKYRAIPPLGYSGIGGASTLLDQYSYEILTSLLAMSPSGLMSVSLPFPAAPGIKFTLSSVALTLVIAAGTAFPGGT